MFGGFLLGLRLGREFSEVFHHGIRINFPNRVFEFTFEFAFKFSLELALPFELALTFTEKVADYIAYGTEPTLAFYFAFELTLEFTFAFEFAFELAFQFVLGLISHIDSSSLDLCDTLLRIRFSELGDDCCCRDASPYSCDLP
jgi:hypothetical protein